MAGKAPVVFFGGDATFLRVITLLPYFLNLKLGAY